MTLIDLNVPYAEKDEAKSLGAKWNPNKKIWYVPVEADPRPFARWLPSISDDDLDVRANHYYIGKTNKTCWKCKKKTPIFGFFLDQGHELLVEYDCSDSERVVCFWEHIDGPATIGYINHLPDDIQNWIIKLTPNFYIDTSKTCQSEYWMNHCDKCGMKQGDFYIHGEPGPGGFFPVTVKEATKITLYRVDEPFELKSCGHGGPVHFFESMKLKPLKKNTGFLSHCYQRLFKKIS